MRKIFLGLFSKEGSLFLLKNPIKNTKSYKKAVKNKFRCLNIFEKL